MKQAQDISPILNENETGSLLYNSGFQASSIYPNSKVYLADCMDLLRQTPDKYYCLACVDPPYGLERFKKGGSHINKHGSEKGLWNNEKPTKIYFEELFRVSQNQIIWGANNFELPTSEYFIIWQKSNAEDFSFAMCEYAWTNCNIPAKVYKKLHIQVGDKNKIHPTQKPVELYSWIYGLYLPQGGKVIDTHLGSGSNRIAANKAGNIDFTGFELDKDYYEAQEKRWKGFIAQTRLF